MAGSAVLDGTLTGNRASLKTTGTMNGSGLGYQENSALDVNAQYTVTVPDLQFAKAQVTSTTAATFVKVGSLELNEVKATTTYQDTKLDFAANREAAGSRGGRRPATWSSIQTTRRFTCRRSRSGPRVSSGAPRRAVRPRSGMGTIASRCRT